MPSLSCTRPIVVKWLSKKGKRTDFGSTFGETLEIPHGTDSFRRSISAMRRCVARPSRTTERELRQIAIVMADRFDRYNTHALRFRLSESRSSIKFIGTSPLELIPCARHAVPLGICRGVSRIPFRPSEALAYLQRAPPQAISLTHAKRILLLRSHPPRDPLRLISNALARQMEDVANGNVRLVDVAHVRDVRRELRRFDGGTVIFDMHGSVRSGRSILHVGGTTWDLERGPDDFPFPPVVVFSACDSAAMGLASCSLVRGALRRGAMAVVGTLLPVGAAEAAAYILRLILRLDQFVPAAHGLFRKAISFAEVFQGLTRMSFWFEALLAYGIAPGTSSWRNAAERMNAVINSQLRADHAWFDELVAIIVQRTRIGSAHILEGLRRELFLSEAARHALFGVPERLSITPE